MNLRKWLFSKKRNLYIKIYTLKTKLLTKLFYGEKVKLGRNFSFGNRSRILINTNSNNDRPVVIEDGFVGRRNLDFRVSHNGYITVGERVFMNDDCSINAMCGIEIGDDSTFGIGVAIYDQNHRFNLQGVPVGLQGFTLGPVKIGNNCWLGRNVTVLKGVTIGDNCVIGAHCLISKDVPPNTLVKLSDNSVQHLPIKFKSPDKE